MKKWLFTAATTFLMAVLVLGASVMEVSAAEKIKTTSDGFSYKISKDNTVEITGYKGKKKNVKFPAKIKGKKVTRIGQQVLTDNRHVVSATISDNVTSVDIHAFWNCPNLTTITVGKNVKEFTVGDDYHDSQDEDGFVIDEDYDYDESQYILTGKNFKEFKVNKKNKVFSAKDGVLFKGKVLVNCPPAKIGTYQVPKGTTGMELYAFADSRLSKVKIPASVRYIGGFLNYEGGNQYSRIASYEVDKGNKTFYSEDGVLFKKDTEDGVILLYYPPEKRDASYRVPENVRWVDQCAFEGHKYLEEVEIPNANVSDQAFTACEKLRKVVFSGNIRGECVFGGCEELTELECVNTNDGRTVSIGEGAFVDCGLRSVILSENVTYIAECDFRGCTSLKWIEIRNKDCKIEMEKGDLPGKTVIYGYPGSTAEVFAKKTGHEFCAIGEAKPEIKNPVTVPGAKIKLLTKIYTYDGEAKKPMLEVKDKSGNRISEFEYRVTYQNNKKPGLGVVKVTFKGYDYKGTIRTTFAIKPPKSTIKKLTPGKNSLTLQWGGVKSFWISGYEIQYSTGSAFKKGNTRTVNVKPNVVKKQIKKLKSGKTYYVRIRSYKTVQREGKAEKLYSKWSGKKKARTL